MKLMLFLHAGDTEVGGFGVSRADDDLLYLEEFVTVRQRVTPVTVAFDDAAVADYFDDRVDAGQPPSRFARVWVHTHPGDSPDPSVTDEQTFARVFGPSDWAVMLIVSRTGRTYCRLSFSAGPGGCVLLPVRVDWTRWPEVLLDAAEGLGTLFERWMDEYGSNVYPQGWEDRPALVRTGRLPWPDDHWMEDEAFDGSEAPNDLFGSDADDFDFDDERVHGRPGGHRLYEWLAGFTEFAGEVRS
jgi:proteasome lid subunit RPN8/RPN11